MKRTKTFPERIEKILSKVKLSDKDREMLQDKLSKLCRKSYIIGSNDGHRVIHNPIAQPSPK